MKVTPKTEKEVMEEGLWPKGTYDFEITDAKDEVSKAQNEMIKLTVKVFNAEGAEKFLFDYLLDEMARKIRHIAVVCGLLDKYENGSLMAEDFKGKTGQCKLGIQKDKTGQYPDKNVITDYSTKITNGTVPVKETVSSGALPIDDEIPF